MRTWEFFACLTFMCLVSWIWMATAQGLNPEWDLRPLDFAGATLVGVIVTLFAAITT